MRRFFGYAKDFKFKDQNYGENSMLFKLINCYQMLQKKEGDDSYLFATLINSDSDITQDP
jgi:hypothetical protein